MRFLDANRYPLRSKRYALSHRRRDELREAAALRELRKPAFEVLKFRLGDALDAEPAPRIGADRDVRERELIPFNETPVRQLRLDDPPHHGFRIDILLDRDH